MEASSESDCDVEDGLIDVMCPFVDIGLNIGLPAFEPGGKTSDTADKEYATTSGIEVIEEDKADIEAILPHNEEQGAAQNLLDDIQPGYNSITCDNTEDNQYSPGLEQPSVSTTGRTWCPPSMQTLDVNYTARFQHKLSTERPNREAICSM